MKKKLFIVCLPFLLFSCAGTSEKRGDSFWDDCEVIAFYELDGQDTVIVCDAKTIKQTRTIPIELIVDDLTVIKFENDREEALIGNRITSSAISENYIGIFCYQFFPFKLFDKNGVFLREIGSFGQGPGEYRSLTDAILDEGNDRIYLLPSGHTEYIFVYDFEGMYLYSIPLAYPASLGSKMKFINENELLITRAIIGLIEPYYVWIQDLDGNLLQGALRLDYYPDDGIKRSTSTCTQLQTENVELFRLGALNGDEYLYHYSTEENRLVPKFRMKNWEEEIFLYELPGYYIAEGAKVFTPADKDDDVYSPKIIIDKQTLRGCYFDGFETPYGIVLDQYDMFFKMTSGDFALVDFGSFIQQRIDRVNKGKLSKKQLKGLEYLQGLIIDEEDDCSLIFLGKIKK